MSKFKKWLHDKLGYGYPIENNGSGDSFQPNYGCEYCEFNLAQDSTGAYFHLSSKAPKPHKQKDKP